VADWGADGLCGERPGSADQRRGFPGGTAEARVDGGPQNPDGYPLGAARERGAKGTIREGTRRAAARPHSFAYDTHHGGTAARNGTIPIIFASVSDPIGSGFVATLSRPGGNVTGFTTIEASLGGKWLELLKEIAPHVNRVAFLFNPETATYAEYYLKLFKAAAATFAVQATTAPVRDRSEVESVIATLAGEPNGGLIVMPDSFPIAHRAEITSLAARYRLPAVYPFRIFAEVGGLLAYGVDLSDNFRRAASYADRILKGEKPGELPVQGPAKFEFVINLKTAKALGLNVPDKLLALADEVIE
jgi:putative tryptophan/tyrosine transport system substrate-binding protein